MEIRSKEELREIISYEEKTYLGEKGATGDKKYRAPFRYRAFRVMTLVRKYEYLIYCRDNCKNPVALRIAAAKIRRADRQLNREALPLGIEITPGTCGKGLRICHGNVVINGFAGNDCVFHGNNVVGNKTTGAAAAVPHLGNGVDVGAGAVIIGGVTIADNCVIGAGAVVTRSFETPGTVIAGVPARAIG